MWSSETRQLVYAAFAEDIGPRGDLTSALLPAGDADVRARIVLREAGTVAGLALLPLICETFGRALGRNLRSEPTLIDDQPVTDGQQLPAGTTIATLTGPHAAVLSTERTLLNFLSRLCGVATLTSTYVAAARRGNTGVQVLDTRKTLPGWRELDKYAVRCGGGTNHRRGLYDAVLIKDNHIAHVPLDRLANTLREMLNELRASNRPIEFVEVEVDRLEQLEEIADLPGIDIVLLDNFPDADLRQAVACRDRCGLRGKLALEASGGINLDTIRRVAATGVDRISVGALTHSATALDLALDI